MVAPSLPSGNNVCLLLATFASLLEDVDVEDSQGGRRDSDPLAGRLLAGMTAVLYFSIAAHQVTTAKNWHMDFIPTSDR